jgi:hypothetical protein
MNVVAEYERQSYSIYAREVGFIKRSVRYQHTHLIKVTNKKTSHRPIFTTTLLPI